MAWRCSSISMEILDKMENIDYNRYKQLRVALKMAIKNPPQDGEEKEEGMMDYVDQ